MKIFLTGHLGYVGNILSEMLVEQNFEVTGCDTGFYPQEFVPKKISQLENKVKDVRNVSKDDLKGHFATIHLAALSNDPLGEINPNLTHEINYQSTIKLAKMAKEAGVKRFIFSSSCSNYGANENTVNEESSLSPLTAYAKSKVDSEKELLNLKDEDFSPIILRNATVYGVSPSQRLDLVVNNLTASAFAIGSVKLLSDGTSWRPLLHVRDMARAFITALKASEEKVNGEIFNVGSNDGNYTIKEIAERVQELVPDSRIEYADDASKDARSYRVDFTKIKNILGFDTKWELDDGITEMYDVLKQKKEFGEREFNDKSYFRVKYIKWLLEEGMIDNNLFVIKKINH